ncbi:MAG TPA: serine hydrolase domain-containing protein, partial [Candidatus Acidoferrum sp.]
MNRVFLGSALVLSALSVAAGFGEQTSLASVENKLDELFSATTSPDAPGLAVGVRQNGKTVFEGGYGLGDLRLKVRIDARTNFRLASFTKQFTAMAIMLLVHDGKLRYDESLTEVFPDFADYGKTITV